MVVIYSLLTAIFFSITFLFRKLAGQTLPVGTALIIEVIVELIAFILLFMILSHINNKEYIGIQFKEKGVWFAVLAGVCVTFGVVSNFMAVKTGLLSRVTSITSPTQIVIGVLLGLILLDEMLTVKQIVGIVISIIGVIILTI